MRDLIAQRPVTERCEVEEGKNSISFGVAVLTSLFVLIAKN
jgi:hypothetical protein